MSQKPLSPEQIDNNWKQFISLIGKIDEPRRTVALAMLNELDEHIALAPASGRTAFHGAYPGGLVEHSLHVLAIALKATKAYGWEDVSRTSVILVCLFHDLGKSCHVTGGGDVKDVYRPQESDWHREKLGESYMIDNEIFRMNVPHRSLWLLQRYGIALTDEEWMAILLHDGWSLEENRKYSMAHTSKLLTLVQHADYVATIEEKSK